MVCTFCSSLSVSGNAPKNIAWVYVDFKGLINIGYSEKEEAIPMAIWVTSLYSRSHVSSQYNQLMIMLKESINDKRNNNNNQNMLIVIGFSHQQPHTNPTL